MNRRTKVLSVAGGGLAAMLLVTSAAFACVSLATLDVSPGKGAPGSTVQAKGTGFNSNAAYSDIEVRWGGANGPLLATVPKASNPSFSFAVPQAAPGTYTISATQLDPSGVPVWGTPARVTFTVSGAAAGVAPAAEAAPVPETIVIEQKYLVPGETPAPAAAPAPAQAASAPAKAAPVAAPAPVQQPGQVLSLEAQDAITQQVAPAGARHLNFVPAADRAASAHSSLRLGIALAVIGSMALLTAAGVAYILRPAAAKVQR